MNQQVLKTLSLLLGMAYGMLWVDPLQAALSEEQLRIQTQRDVQSIVEPQLRKYCADFCELIAVTVETDQEVTAETELGFEGLTPTQNGAKFYVKKINVEIQIDDRVTASNRQRLETLLMNRLRPLALQSEIIWRVVSLPHIGRGNANIDLLKRRLETQLSDAVKVVMSQYCPKDCLLGYIDIKGEMISLDEASRLNDAQLVWSESGDMVMRIQEVRIDVTINETIDPIERERILSIMQAKTAFAQPVQIRATVMPFPKTYEDEKKMNDPYGLEKLRQMLIMFRELAGTKEIVKHTRQESVMSSVSEKESKTEASDKSSIVEKEQSRTRSVDSLHQQESQASVIPDWAFWAILGLMVLVVIFGVMRYLSAVRDQKAMMNGVPVAAAGAAPASGLAVGHEEHGAQSVSSAGTSNKTRQPELALRFKIEALKDELMEQFLQDPRVAHETFARILKEDGVETTARYLQIFGHVIVMELIDDPNVSRDLYALSEFFNKARFVLSEEEQLQLLERLKRKMTAAEIRVLSNKSSQLFKFLDKLDPAQIYALISDEKLSVQTIVLTQLDKKRRLAVFDMYQGAAKLNLMNQLARADAIPKEYLNNVAKALARKVQGRPEFDTENIRSSEIILDLMERSPLSEQRRIMANLRQTNPETARSIMMKLVTVEFLPYLKDGHLLELVLGMEREDLVVFLAGTHDHIRALLLSKAPQELAESWMEDLEHVGSIDEQTYQLVELKIINRIRSLAESGAINILDINEMIFSEEQQQMEAADRLGQLSQSAALA